MQRYRALRRHLSDAHELYDERAARLAANSYNVEATMARFGPICPDCLDPTAKASRSGTSHSPLLPRL